MSSEFERYDQTNKNYENSVLTAFQCRNLYDINIINTTIRWSASHIMNKDLLKDYLNPIPNNFSSNQEWSTAFLVFVLEELRAQLASCLTKNVTEVHHYRMTAESIKSEDASYMTLLVRSDVNREPEAIRDFETSYNTFALLVRGDEILTTKAQFQAPEHIICHIGNAAMIFDDDTKTMTVDPSALYITLHKSNKTSMFTDIKQSARSDSWRLYLLALPSTPSTRICNGLLQPKRPYFMRDVLTAEPRSQAASQTLAVIDDALVASKTSALNRSQIEAVESVLASGLQGYPKIRLIKGPPGNDIYLATSS